MGWWQSVGWWGETREQLPHRAQGDEVGRTFQRRACICLGGDKKIVATGVRCSFHGLNVFGLVFLQSPFFCFYWMDLSEATFSVFFRFFCCHTSMANKAMSYV